MERAYWRNWTWDGLGLSVAGLCFMHCLATSVLVVILATAGGFLVNPIIHEAGLALAIVFGSLALGKGALDHGLMLPAAIGSLGIGIMAGALTLPHSTIEVFYTMLGVGILSLGHILNHRATL